MLQSAEDGQTAADDLTADAQTEEDRTAEETGFSETLISERTQNLIPETIEDILSFADSYNAPEQVEAVFRWDVSDIFYNYFFIGNYVNVGGPQGDDEEQIDIYNPDAIRCPERLSGADPVFLH